MRHVLVVSAQMVLSPMRTRSRTVRLIRVKTAPLLWCKLAHPYGGLLKLSAQSSLKHPVIYIL